MPMVRRSIPRTVRQRGREIDKAISELTALLGRHPTELDALASNIALTAENFGDALEDPSFLAMLAALVNSGYWFFEG